MPLVIVKPSPDWCILAAVDLQKKRFTQAFVWELPGIVADACSGMSEDAWGKCSPEDVLPDVVAPFGIVVPGATPDLDVSVMPNYTPERYASQYYFRRGLIEALRPATEALADKYSVPFPQIDVNVAFVMGCGAALGIDGGVSATWPDDFKQVPKASRSTAF